MSVHDLHRWRTFTCGLIFVWFLCDFTKAFNVDIRSPVLHHGPPQSMFGFTVAEYKEAGRSWVLIGAPEAEDKLLNFEEADYKGGSVFACDANDNDRCTVLRFPSNAKVGNQKADYKGRQWLGATLVTSGANGAIVVCAPRYYWFTPSKNSNAYREPVGTCYYSYQGFSNFTEYSPCRINTRTSFGYAKLGSCQAGFSAAIAKDSERFYLGAVGSYYWQGQLFSLHRALQLQYVYDIQESVFDITGRLVTRTFLGRPEFTATEQGPTYTDDSYMGYSVTNLAFYGSNITGAAVGVPRADQLIGKVSIYTWNIVSIKNLTGEQFAAFFGYSISTADVDNDGADDLIIGAPMYSNYKSLKNDYETGRVYIYYQGNVKCSDLNAKCGEFKFDRHDFINGEHSKGRFGLAVASIGDINQDGFGDIAVGAPYEGSHVTCNDVDMDHSGAVYVYHGSRNGIRKKYAQKITAADVYHLNRASSYLNAFGFSISGGQDLDGNSYPDLVVGAYKSNVVYTFKSRPVIQLSANLTFLMEKKVIAMNDQRCIRIGDIWVPCPELSMCLQYDGIGVEDEIWLDIKITLDSKNQNSPSRMYFLSDRDAYRGLNRTDRSSVEHIRLYKGTSLCKRMSTYVIPLGPSQDRLTPIEATLTYSMDESTAKRQRGLISILNMDDESPLMRKDSLNIKNNCGDDNICIPDLRMTIKSNVDKFELGSKTLYFNVTVSNDGEDSFGSAFRLKVPEGLIYQRFEVSKTSDMAVSCSDSPDEKSVTICSVGNPLPKGKIANFSVILEPYGDIRDSVFEFWASVNSTNQENAATVQDNQKTLSMQILEKTSISIESSSTPGEVYYNSSQYDFDKIETDIQAGPSLRHEYVIKNTGPTDISEASAVFYWPLKLATGEDLLYLISEPERKGNVYCEPIVNPNYRRLQIIRTGKKDTSESGSSQGSSSKFSFTQETHESTKVTHSGSANDYPRPINTGGKGNDYPKGDGNMHVGGFGFNQPNQGGSYTYDYSYTIHNGGQNGQGQGNYYDTSYGNQGGSVGSTHSGNQGFTSVQTSQGGFTGIQTNQYSGSSQGGYSGSVHSNEGGYTGTIQTSQGGLSGTQTNQGSYSGSSQGGYTGTIQTSQGGYTTGTQTNQGGYSGTINTSQAGYTGQSSQGGYTSHTGQVINTSGSQGGYYNTHQEGGTGFTGTVSGDRKKISSFHESNTVYTKTTDLDGNNPKTVSKVDWKTNDDGVIRKGSYSDINYGFGYDANSLNTNKKTVFSGEDRNRVYTHEAGSSGHVDINAINTGSSRTYVDPVTGTRHTYEEGVVSGNPEVHRNLNETGSIRHVKTESIEIVKPNREYGTYSTYQGDASKVTARVYKSPDQVLQDDDGYNNDKEIKNDEDEEDEEDDDNDDEEDESGQPHHRRTRQVYGSFADNSFCSYAQCIRVECTISPLKRNGEVSIAFPSIVWVRTVQNITRYKPVQVGSYVEVFVKKNNRVRAQVSNVTYVSEILTNVTSLDFGKTPPDVIPLWVVVGSACLGALILMLLILLLYKSGFFKRNRPPVMPERQPLNRNGQYHLGDEAL